MDLERMQALLTALQEARFAGLVAFLISKL